MRYWLTLFMFGMTLAAVGAWGQRSGTLVDDLVPVLNNSIGDAPDTRCKPGDLFIDINPGNDRNCATVNDNSLCLCIAPNTWRSLENN